MKPDFNMNIDSKDICNIVVAGDLTIQHALDFKRFLEKVPGACHEVSISLGGVTAIDATALQLLHCFRNETVQRKIVFPEAPASTAVMSLLIGSGLEQIITS